MAFTPERILGELVHNAKVASKENGRGWRRLLAPDRLIYGLLLVAAGLRIAAIYNKGIMYDGNFVDAIRFMDSARELAASGRFTYAGSDLSAYQMPGFSAFLSLFVLATGTPLVQQLFIKSTFLLMSIASIYLLFLLGRRIGGPWVGLVACTFLTFSMPNIYTGLLVLSENPFSLAVIALTLLVIRLGDAPGWKCFVAALAVFVAALYLRQAALMLLPPAIVYLWLRRYPRRLLVQQALTAAVIIVAVLTPWWFRNYQVFDTFVPFTSFEGAPLLEGTFQRFHPIDSGAFARMGELTEGFQGNELEKGRIFANAARQRVAQRWRTDPADLIFTYAIGKPAATWLLPHYWDTVLGASSYWVLRIHALVSAFGLLALLLLSVRSRARYEFMFMGLCVLLITFGTIYYLGLHRYVYPFMPFLYVAIAYSLIRLLSRALGFRHLTPLDAKPPYPVG